MCIQSSSNPYRIHSIDCSQEPKDRNSDYNRSLSVALIGYRFGSNYNVKPLKFGVLSEAFFQTSASDVRVLPRLRVARAPFFSGAEIVGFKHRGQRHLESPLIQMNFSCISSNHKSSLLRFVPRYASKAQSWTGFYGATLEESSVTERLRHCHASEHWQ